MLVIIAFATVFIVWGSTYFFIGMAVHGFPPMLLGAARFLTAGLLMLAWCWMKGDRIWIGKKELGHAAISGLLMLFISVGGVIWAEQVLPSAMVAIMVSANPIWFIILDKANWRVNLRNKTTVYGLIPDHGFAGILLLFGESLIKSVSGGMDHAKIIGLLIVVTGPIAWCAGGLWSKKHPGTAPARLNTGWQMLIAGVAFIPASLAHHEFRSFRLSQVPLDSWLAIAYLIVFGSIAAFSAYIWLLQVRTATQVSIHSYVNPVVAVMLGVWFAHESISGYQISGLLIILFSVLLVSLPKYGKFHFRKIVWGRPQVNKC